MTGGIEDGRRRAWRTAAATCGLERGFLPQDLFVHGPEGKRLRSLALDLKSEINDFHPDIAAGSWPSIAYVFQGVPRVLQGFDMPLLAATEIRSGQFLFLYVSAGQDVAKGVIFSENSLLNRALQPVLFCDGRCCWFLHNSGKR